jgi:zinc D-Ala-D-Ala carboxypeptidase
MTPHFSLAEFTFSQTAARRGIDNNLPESLRPAAIDTLQMMEAIRHALGGVPVIITSGYRSPALNTAIGGSKRSDHMQARAVDFRAPAFGTPLAVCNRLAPMVDELGIGQLIHEFGSWVHVSTALPLQPVNRVITISQAGTFPGIREA